MIGNCFTYLKPFISKKNDFIIICVLNFKNFHNYLFKSLYENYDSLNIKIWKPNKVVKCYFNIERTSSIIENDSLH